MGRANISALITQAKAENAYNNSGISSNGQWVAFFNEALRDLVEDINITKVGTLDFIVGTREYDLPEDYYAINHLTDSNKLPVRPRRLYAQEYPPGYWIFNRGDNFVIDLNKYNSNQTFSYEYVAYPEELDLSNLNTQQPQIPTVGEKALIYYALDKGLRNNNQFGQAQDCERRYQLERQKIRSAVARGAG